MIKRCKEANIESVYGIMEMEDNKRNDLLQMDVLQLYVGLRIPFKLTKRCPRCDAATFVNSYPTLDVSFKTNAQLEHPS